MVSDKIVYTDGRDVTVTEASLQVKSARYNLHEIKRHGLSIIYAKKFPGVAFCIIGGLLVTLALLNAMPFGLNVYENDSYDGPNTFALWIGAGFLALGVLILLMVKRQYAVQIETDSEKKNVIISRDREYVEQVSDALNEALKRMGKEIRNTHNLSGT